MSSSYWVKWRVDLLDAPDVARLPDSAWRRYGEAHLLAKDIENPNRPDLAGFLPDLPRAAWRLHLSDEVLADDFTRLALAGLMELRPHPEAGEDRWYLTHYVESQRAATAAERMRVYRQKGGDVTKSNGRVTQRKSKSKSKSKKEDAAADETIAAGHAAAATPASAASAAADFAEMLAGYGISGSTVGRLWAAGLRVTDAELVDEHIRAATARGEGVGLVITRLLNGEHPPGAHKNGRGRPSLENQVPSDLMDVVQR